MAALFSTPAFRYLFRNWVWFEYSVLAIIPLFGIYVLHWSVGNLIFLFYYEFVLTGVFTALRMLCAYRADGCFFRFLAPLVFSFAYTCFTFVFLFTTSHLFETAAEKLQFTIDGNMLYVMIGVYTFNFIFGFLFSGHYRDTAAENESNETYTRTFFLILILWIMVLPFHWIKDPAIASYVLGSGIILARSAFGLLYALYRNKKTLKDNL